MKFWLLTGYLFSFTNLNGLVPGNALHIRYNNCLLISYTYLSRCKLWMNYLLYACKQSFYILCLFIYVGRRLYYRSYVFLETWNTRVILLFIVTATAFIGYVLPWGQISFWGATVISNLLSAISYISINLAQWIWGSFSVDKATLTQFFPLDSSIYHCSSSCCPSTNVSRNRS